VTVPCFVEKCTQVI